MNVYPLIYLVAILTLTLAVMAWLERPRSRHRLNKRIEKDDWFNDKENGI